MSEKKEGMVKDLVEKVRRGELKPEEAKEEALKRGLHHQKFEHPPSALLSYFLGGTIIGVYVVAKITKLEILRFIAELPSFHFPPLVKVLATILCGVGMIMLLQTTYIRTKKGGTKDEDETIILIKNGFYGVIRHPSLFGMSILFPMGLIALSGYIPFNILTAAGSVMLFGGGYFVAMGEERVNIIKWEDEYRQYMKEVPRFNLIKGLWNLRKRK